MKLLKRDDYKEIEEFNNYELTPCIAYEMAIRNQNVKEILHNLDRLAKYQDKAILVRIANDEELSRSLRYFEMIEKDHNEFMDKFEDFPEIGMSHIARLQEILENDLIENYRIYPKGYYRKIVGMLEVLGERIEHEIDDKLGSYHNDGVHVSRKIYDGFKVYQGLYSDEKKHFANHILPNFKREVNDEPILVTLDLSRPIEEIEAYISHIKKILDDSDDRIVKLSKELMGEELEKAADIKNMSTINSKGTRKTFESRWGSQLQQKFADMFFIYDAVNAGMKKSAILDSLDSYHDPDSNRKDSFHPDTYYKYLAIATEYIKNKKYLELITGVKPKNNSS